MTLYPNAIHILFCNLLKQLTSNSVRKQYISQKKNHKRKKTISDKEKYDNEHKREKTVSDKEKYDNDKVKYFATKIYKTRSKGFRVWRSV
jgi:hypothetical protein